jgi:cytochrome c556
MRRTAVMRSVFAGALVAIFAMVSSVAAHDLATGVVKERMDAMESMAKAMKAITQRIKANRDLGSIKGDAQAIRELALKMTLSFPPGSNQHPSGAKPAIWQKWPDFESKARVLAAESDKLAQTDARDAKSIAAQARVVSQSCGKCHEVYRQKQ